ncbi:hypothetical protein C8Q80DRAFT_1163052 [Daedaleopsis nitida]|nr:hypothetical protein C8Q80DRAFT_1163052 [Daedaleopsis nitida]
MAKPRNSVLFMFDPLHQSPSTPRRDSSDDLGPSDKENDIPQGDLTIFFNRTYAAQKQELAAPFTPKGKLIDIGDTPASQCLWDAAEHDGSDADGEQSESDAEGCGVLSPARVPLAELDVEHTPRPQDSSRPLKALIFASATSPTMPLPGLLAPAPESSPLAEVVNSINLSGLIVSEETQENHPTITIPPTGQSEDSRPASPCPEINICSPPETPCMEDFDVPSEEDVSVATNAQLRPPTTLTQLSPDDVRRTSVDLYSSFHMQMQSEDMSFDLLNDKVSFLANGQDSFWSGGDDTLDFSEICVPAPTMAKLEKLIQPALSIETVPKKFEPVFSPPARATAAPSVMSPTLESAIHVPLPMSPTSSAPPSRHTTPPHTSPFALMEPPSPPTSPVIADEPSLLLESEPLPPPMPAPIPALRIVKKTFKMAGHQSAMLLSNSKPTIATERAEKQASVLKRRSSLSVAKPVISSTTTSQPPMRPPIRGVQRPPSSMQNAGGMVIGLPPQGGSINTTASTASTASSSSSGTSAPASRFAGIQRPNFAAKERAAPKVTTGGPRAVPSATTAARSGTGPARVISATISKGTSGTTGVSAIRPPTRIVAPGSTGLPKPASRLPGLTRTASMSSHAGSIAMGGGAATRPKASTMSRASRF